MQEDDRKFITQIGKGGQQAESAHKALFMKYRGNLKRFLMKFRMSPEDSDELVQETFLKVWLKAKDYEGRASVRSWIWSIGHNCMIDLLRKKSAQHLPKWEADAEEDLDHACVDPVDPSVDGSNFDFSLCVKRGLQGFEQQHPERAEALRLVAMGWTNDEISEVLKRNLGATREYISQCRKVLEQFIALCRKLLVYSAHQA